MNELEDVDSCLKRAEDALQSNETAMSMVDGRRQLDDGPIPWSKVKSMLRMTEEALAAKNEVAKMALNESERYQWLLEEEKDKGRDEMSFLEMQMDKLSVEKSQLQRQVDMLQREKDSLRSELMLLKAQFEDDSHHSGGISPLKESTRTNVLSISEEGTKGPGFPTPEQNELRTTAEEIFTS